MACPVAIAAALVLLTGPAATHFEASAPVRIKRQHLYLAPAGAYVQVRMNCGYALRLNWQGVEGCEYRVEWSADAFAWSSNNIIWMGANEPLEFYDGITDGRRFYRIISAPVSM